MKKMTTMLSVIAMLCFMASSCLAVEPDDILGSWLTEGGHSCVEISKQEDRYFATITALEFPNFTEDEEEGMEGKPRVDLHNPDESLRGQSLIGLELMKGFEFNGKQWVDGRIYDPDNGKTYKCKMTLEDGGILNVRGFIGVSLLGRTTVWMRPDVFVEQQGQPLTFACPAK
jgi:uncharacterized protein (DUF2147 family)